MRMLYIKSRCNLYDTIHLHCINSTTKVNNMLVCFCNCIELNVLNEPLVGKDRYICTYFFAYIPFLIQVFWLHTRV